jgi:cytochrome P450
VNASFAVTKWHPSLRPFVAPFLKEIKSLKECYKFAADKLEPQVESILQSWKQNKRDGINSHSSSENQFNLLHWILNHYKRPEKANAAVLAKEQMSVAFGAIHTTGMRTMNMILDLAAHPDVAAEIREEYETILKEEGRKDGKMTKITFPKLKKLDSFMLESQRMNPSSLSTFLLHSTPTSKP